MPALTVFFISLIIDPDGTLTLSPLATVIIQNVQEWLHPFCILIKALVFSICPLILCKCEASSLIANLLLISGFSPHNEGESLFLLGIILSTSGILLQVFLSNSTAHPVAII